MLTLTIAKCEYEYILLKGDNALEIDGVTIELFDAEKTSRLWIPFQTPDLKFVEFTISRTLSLSFHVIRHFSCLFYRNCINFSHGA